MENRNRQVLLKRRPTGAPTTADFEIADGPMPDPGEGEGEVLVRGIYLSLDPYMRGRISAALVRKTGRSRRGHGRPGRRTSRALAGSGLSRR
jgi:NADPH-dependent curcumin reductase CurA